MYQQEQEQQAAVFIGKMVKWLTNKQALCSGQMANDETKMRNVDLLRFVSFRLGSEFALVLLLYCNRSIVRSNVGCCHHCSFHVLLAACPAMAG